MAEEPTDAEKLAAARKGKTDAGQADGDLRFAVTVDEVRYLVSMNEMTSAEARLFRQIEGMSLGRALQDWDLDYAATLAYLVVRRARPEATLDEVRAQVTYGTVEQQPAVDEEDPDAPEA